MSPGCTQEVRADLTQHQFEIGDRSLIISLPPEFQRDPNVPFVQFWRPKHRIPRHLIFTTNLPDLENSHKLVNLRQGGQLRYGVVTTGSGSGGTEMELFGYITLDSTKIGIIATDQDEFSPNPKWCIEFLHGLRFK